MFHRESRDLLVYELVLLPGGLKLQPEKPDTPEFFTVAPLGASKARLIAKASFETLADRLTNILQRPTVNVTNLDGIYSMDFLFEPAGGPPSSGAAVDRDPPIESAIQVLGIRLQSRKRKVEMIIVDKVDEIPTENR